MQLIYLFTIAFLNSIDNIGVGAVYSVAGVKVKLFSNIILAVLAFGVSFIAALSGKLLSNFFSEEACSIISMLILVIMGINMILSAYYKKRNIDTHKVKELKYKEALYVGAALAFDDIGSSVSSALVGYSPFMISLPFFIISLAIFFFGNYTLKYTTKFKLGNKPTIVAGIMMILLGISQIFG